MTHEEMERAIEFLLHQEGKLNADLGVLTETVSSIIVEMREGFSNLIIANEVTRDLASQAAKLAIATLQA
jgi:L-aminopeptidase/D-esterase-like protein